MEAHRTPSAASSAAKPSFSGSSPLGNPSVEAHHTPSATPSAAKPSFSGSSPASQERPRPTHEEIARRAYEHFLLRSQSGGQSGGQSGDKDKEDWYKAEQELLSKK